MNTELLEELIGDLRLQASTWMGEEACSKLERLVAHTRFLQGQVDGIERLRADGYRLVKTVNAEAKSN
jgi:hypothetical protein